MKIMECACKQLHEMKWNALSSFVMYSYYGQRPTKHDSNAVNPTIQAKTLLRSRPRKNNLRKVVAEKLKKTIKFSWLNLGRKLDQEIIITRLDKPLLQSREYMLP